jgi:putative membrane protein insertion efficiency factor
MPTAFLAVLTRALAVPQQTLLLLVRGYRYFLSPCLGPVCRYEPTCSAYALQALQRDGAVVGSARAAWRILRCNPWCEGGHDPLPAPSLPRPGSSASGLFTRLLDRERAPSTESPHDPIAVRKLP